MNKNYHYKPIFLREERLAQKLLKQKPYLVYVDALKHQLKELFFIENNNYIGQEKKIVFKTKDFIDFCDKNSNYYIYVYYPWNNTLVKTIKKDKYLTLKTNRNKNLITSDEQKKLRDLRLGVFGMSVGSNIAFVLTQAGISNSITLADFDKLDTTNLNRILAGAHQIGLDKTIIAARHIYEDNPFANVRLMMKGVNNRNLEALLKAKQLDCIIEEIDDISMKIETRILAKKYKIPVIMITDNGDGVVLHVERYDLGYKKIFNKDISYWNKILKNKITKEQAGFIIMNDIVGGIKNVDPKMVKSVKDVLDKKLVSWSQLGSAAILGGVIATYATKQIFKNKTLYIQKNFNISL
ncbi:MAG: ThiF family adenylyltransferase, partial [Candidatus Pacebacteria bacterium]|nr:ThiF family adenylyltransferase [Candidatus Paceibacterota bacterium]